MIIEIGLSNKTRTIAGILLGWKREGKKGKVFVQNPETGQVIGIEVAEDDILEIRQILLKNQYPFKLLVVNKHNQPWLW